MRRNRTLINIPINKGLNSEPSSAKLIGDGEWYSLINARPYQGDLIRRYGDNVLGNALSSLSPLGLFFFNSGGTDTLFLMTTDGTAGGGKIKYLASPYSGNWADLATTLNKDNTWTAAKFTNAPTSKTYILFANNSDDIVTWDGSAASNLTTVSGTAAHRPTKARCVTNFGNMCIAANATALKPFLPQGDSDQQINELILKGISIGTDLYWEIDYDHIAQQPNPQTPIAATGAWKDKLQWTLNGVDTSLTGNAPGGSCYYTISAPAVPGATTPTITCNIYSDSARTVLVATGTAIGTLNGASGNGGWNYDYTMQPFTVAFSSLKHYVTQGDNTTRIDVTLNGGTTRYTWDGTGTNPNFGSRAVGDMVVTTGFTAANNISNKVITAKAATYIEVTNAGFAENDKTNVTFQFSSPGLNGSVSAAVEVFYSSDAWTDSGEIRVSDAPDYDESNVVTFNLYTYSAPTFTLVSTGSYTATQDIAGQSIKINLSTVGSSTVEGTVDLIVKDFARLKSTSQVIDIDNETDPLLVRWCDPYDLTAWQQQSYEKLPPGGAGGILGTIVVNGVLYFLFENTIHRASLTGNDEFPLRFEYDVCPAGCPNPKTAFEYGGNLVFMAKDGTWKSFDGFKLVTLSDPVLAKLKGFAPTTTGFDTRFGIAYLNAGATGSEEKLLGCVMGNSLKFFEELHAYHMSYLCSGIDQVYATNLNGTTLTVAALNDLTKTTVDFTNTQISYECLTKEYMFGDNTEGHVLRCIIYGDSNSTVVTITPYINGAAGTAQDIILSTAGVVFEINQWATSLQLKIASKSGSASTTFKVYRVEAELHNTRKK